MTDPYRKVRTGTPISDVMRAATHNATMRAAEAHRDGQARTGSSSSGTLGANQVWVLNDSGDDLDALSIVAITGAIYPEDDDDPEYYLFRPMVTVDLPGRDLDFAVLADPIPSDEMGRAWVAGVCPARIVGAGTRLAAITGDAEKLQCGDTGSAVVLWDAPDETQPGDDPERRLALIRFTGAGGGGARLGCTVADWTPGAVIDVTLENPGDSEEPLVSALAPNTDGTDTAGMKVLLIPLSASDAAATLADYHLFPRECEPSCGSA